MIATLETRTFYLICCLKILPVVLYSCETCSQTLRKKQRLRVFENRVLRRIFRPKRDEVKESWRNCTRMSFEACTLHQV
jgi:hypothetical protein